MENRYGLINKTLLVLGASALCIWILWFVNWMVSGMERDENDKVEIWAKSTVLLAQEHPDDSEVIDLLLDIVRSNDKIPVIITTSDDEVISYRNLTPSDSVLSASELASYLDELKSSGQSLEIPVCDGNVQHLYYGRSRAITRLAYFPLLEIGLLTLLIVFAYLVFSGIKRREQDKVWIGLARETAHQLGTPITALSGWTDLLDSGDIDAPTASSEIRHDVERLKSIADRFSKIGSVPEMEQLPVDATVSRAVAYLQSRIPSRVSLSCDTSQAGNLSTLHNPVLIGWAVENLCRNAVDATEGSGSIVVYVRAEGSHAIIDVKDTGKGMSRLTARKIFAAGFTTKKRGWGIGLTLTRRIIEEYHRGKVFVLNTEVGRGTTIRIVI